eukprot:CAMPEP_0113539670 /NCGR_PEP_ID=MMETSP0015_2-20120614/8055_1 /TAXON_ID=2838 /ORGANISM="Odontella" /LENGTH=464 /DNA_ID=CAMNT_0000439391 /DNA_START=636 /DNA_END=2030 /DNA_ORIENTATION=+ /assembly_acc=CAM_ASM_000160
MPRALRLSLLVRLAIAAAAGLDSAAAFAPLSSGSAPSSGAGAAAAAIAALSTDGTSSSSRPNRLLRSESSSTPPRLSRRTALEAAAAADDDDDQRADSKDDDDDDDEAARLRARAESLREQIRSMESDLGDDRGRSRPSSPAAAAEAPPPGMSLRDKRVLVVGANGRVGSMVCRRLLRTHPEVREVVAHCHVVSEASTRGWGRLSYEVGAEDGTGSIGPAWSPDDRDDMAGYNLNKMRIVEAELLDPVQCATITEGVDSVIWCATDFNGNQPRAVAALNVAFLFRAVASPDKGRVEIEGLRNVLGGLKADKQNRRWKGSFGGDAAEGAEVAAASGSSSLDGPNDPLSFVLLSASRDAYEDYETPFGTFRAQKREGEDILLKEFPSLSYAALQMSRYDDNFVEEGLDAKTEETEGGMKDFSMDGGVNREKFRRRINRRDAAREAVDALTDEGLRGKVVEMWTDER